METKSQNIDNIVQCRFFSCKIMTANVFYSKKVELRLFLLHFALVPSVDNDEIQMQTMPY